MKKQKLNFLKLLLSLSFSATLLLSACSQDELINDPATGDILPAQESVYHDGSFKAATKVYDGNGYGQILELLIKNGTLTKVQYHELNQDGVARIVVEGSDYSWEGLPPLNLASLYSKLYTDLIINQSPNKIDAISSATKTSDTFKLLSKAALTASIKNDLTMQIIETETTYTSKSQIDAKENQGILIATFSGEKLLNLDFDEVNLQNNTMRSKSNELINGVPYRDLYDSFTRLTLENQNLDPIFKNEPLTPEQEKYNDCLAGLRIQRVNFSAS